MSHHHVAIGVIFLISGHFYRTNFRRGHIIRSLVKKHRMDRWSLETYRDYTLYLPTSTVSNIVLRGRSRRIIGGEFNQQMIPNFFEKRENINFGSFDDVYLRKINRAFSEKNFKASFFIDNKGGDNQLLYKYVVESIHLQLSLALASLGVVTSLVAQHMYRLPPYVFIGSDFTTTAALYVHHQYIAGFIMVGAFVHGAIFLVRDFSGRNMSQLYGTRNDADVLTRVLQEKETLIAHLRWVCLFLGFHITGLYVHNDVFEAFGMPEKKILIEPIFAQWVQCLHGKTFYNFGTLFFNQIKSLFWSPGWFSAINDSQNSLFLIIGPGDFLAHHAIALGLHTTTLILVKGGLDARGSKLMPDKKDFGYSFPCDGPGRGGTCDISG